jgi:DNA replication protein DnaC
MHINVLDVETNGVAEREALSLLESRVLENPQQAGAAWSTLLQLAADLSQRRSGIDEAGLRAALEQAGIPLKGPARYDNDIAKLKNHAKATIRYLAHNSQIPVGQNGVRVERCATEAIRQASEADSIVIVGLPGAGKSGVLHDFADSAIDGGRDVVFIAVDQIGATSLGELRNELGLEHELIEVLRNWPGQRSGILVIDALDAARGDPASAALLNLIRAIVHSGSRWRVVTSIRKYDLRYSPGLRELFRGNLDPAVPLNLQDREFTSLRHVNVPLFTDEELNAVRRQAPALDALLRAAPPVLHDLLRVPFNLRLMAEILESGVDVDDLRPIRTQSELLNRYWAYRVAGTGGGDLRERVLRRVCTLMIEARRLRAERQRVVELGSAEALQQLLSNQVLVEWQPSADAAPQRQQLAFSHNILFDFATSQLFLPSESADVVRLLATDPDLILMIRPSIVMRYQQLWDTNREALWVVVFGSCSDPLLSAVGKVIGAAVLAESARTLQDFHPLVKGLQSGSAPERAAAETTFRHLVGALTAGPATTFAGVDAGPYCELLQVVTRAPNEYVAGYAQTLLRVILDQPSYLTGDQFLVAGQAARNLLSFAWTHQ